MRVSAADNAEGGWPAWSGGMTWSGATGRSAAECAMAGRPLGAVSRSPDDDSSEHSTSSSRSSRPTPT